MFIQKLEYIHHNPVRAGLCELPENYHYSSAKFYREGSNSFNMLTHLQGTKFVYEPVGQGPNGGLIGFKIYKI